MVMVGVLLLACTRAVAASGAAACFHPVDDMPFVMAYRGASAAFPEHSIGAYRAAVAQGARFIECDVVLSRDLVPLCRHEPNIAQTTDVLARTQRPLHSGEHGSERSEDGPGSGPLDPERLEEAVVLAADLTLAEVKQLRAFFPGGPGGSTTAVASTAAGPAGAQGARERTQRCSPGDEGVQAAAGECTAPWAVGPSGKATRSAEAAADSGAGGREADAGADTRTDADANAAVAASAGAGAEAGRVAVAAVDGFADLRVASLEDLLRMAITVEPAVGVALHIQSAAWHNTALGPQLAVANTTFEDLLLELLRQYGYAAGPYGSEAWRRRPSYIMAFEAGSLRYLAQRTSSPLTQVLGPTIPDTGESWESATSPEGLARIAEYAGSVAVARQQLLEPPRTPAAVSAGAEAAPLQAQGAAGGSAQGLVASEPLLRMRRAGLQVFASVFKPAPREQLLAGAETWVDEVAPLVLGTGLIGAGDEAEGKAGKGEVGDGFGPGPGAGLRLGPTIDGLFTDSPGELHRVLAGLRCGGCDADGGSGTPDSASTPLA